MAYTALTSTVQQVKEFREFLHKKSMALIDRKGADYNRDQQEAGDTLFNLRVSEILGVVPSTEEGILVRLSDKFMRLISLTKPGREAAVRDESVLDTIADIHNYVDYLGLIWLQRREAQGKDAVAYNVPEQEARKRVQETAYQANAGTQQIPTGSGACLPGTPVIHPADDPHADRALIAPKRVYR